MDHMIPGFLQRGKSEKVVSTEWKMGPSVFTHDSRGRLLLLTSPYRVWILTRTFTYRVKKNKTLDNDFYVSSHFNDIYSSLMHGFHFIKMLKKYMFVLHIKHMQRKINGFTLFAIDNMYYVNFIIQEQESVSWCGEIQNQRLEVLRNTLNLHSNSTCA